MQRHEENVSMDREDTLEKKNKENLRYLQLLQVS